MNTGLDRNDIVVLAPIGDGTTFATVALANP